MADANFGRCGGYGAICPGLMVLKSLMSALAAAPACARCAAAPVGFQIHVMLAWGPVAAWPFTRLVHVFSAPFGSLTRPYIVYRSRGLPATDPRARRGWEPVRRPGS
jgi:nitrate reductase gamma subunit